MFTERRRVLGARQSSTLSAPLCSAGRQRRKLRTIRTSLSYSSPVLTARMPPPLLPFTLIPQPTSMRSVNISSDTRSKIMRTFVRQSSVDLESATLPTDLFDEAFDEVNELVKSVSLLGELPLFLSENSCQVTAKHRCFVLQWLWSALQEESS